MDNVASEPGELMGIGANIFSNNDAGVGRFFLPQLLLGAFILMGMFAIANAQVKSPILRKFLPKISVENLVENASSYGAIRDDYPVAPILKGSTLLGYAFITSDFVSTTGYSGKPIHVMVAIAPDGKLLRAKLVKHSEPIVLIGIPDRKIKALTESYSGLDIVKEAAAGGDAHDLHIISGATVTIMIIDDSIVRSSIKVARALGLGGLAAKIADRGPQYILNMNDTGVQDWATLSGDGSVRRLTLDVGQINRAFKEQGDERALKRREPGDAGETYIDLNTTLVSAPSIGRSVLGDAEYDNLFKWLKEGEQAIMIAGRGRYSFKGSGYVRGGIFDRIQLIQGDISIRFRDRQHRRFGKIAAEGAPTFTELDLFKIPADSEFDPTKPWRLQLLVNRPVGPIQKVFLTFDLGFKIPSRYLLKIQSEIPVETTAAQSSEDDAEARTQLWQRIWRDKRMEIGGVLAMLAVLTVIFFFQKQVTRNERHYYWLRMSFLLVTLLFLGWHQNAQLSVVNLIALGASMQEGFTWDTFLLDPLVFILWISVAAALLF